MPTFWSPNTFPNKKIPAMPSQAVASPLFATCLWFLAEVNTCALQTLFACATEFCSFLQNYKPLNNSLFPSSQEMLISSLNTGLFVTAWSGQTVWVMDMLNLASHFHCHPSDTSSTGGPQRSKLKHCQRTTKFGKGDSGSSHRLLLGWHPFWGKHTGKEHFTFFLRLWTRWGLQDLDVQTRKLRKHQFHIPVNNLH